jgi:tRNA isopentenyl-2-thiomethyl-A-37 hydroxylase MiaE
VAQVHVVVDDEETRHGAEANTDHLNSRRAHLIRTDARHDACVIEVARLRSTHPWVHVRTVVFTDDTIGVGTNGEPARVEQDVVITAIVPARDGGVLVILRPYVDEAVM